MPMTDFAIVRKSLVGRSLSTVITVLTVAVAVCFLVLLLGLRGAAKASFERGTGNVTVLVTRDASPLAGVLNSMFYANPPPRPIGWAEFEQLRVSSPWAFTVPVQHGDSFNGFPVTATDQSFFTAFEPIAGRPFSMASGEIFSGSFQAVLGSEVATGAFVELGDRIYLSHGGPRDPGTHPHEEFAIEVVGILSPTNSPHDRAVFIDLETSWTIHAHDRRLEVTPTDQRSALVTTPADVIDADRLITGVYASVLTRPGQSASAALPAVMAGLSRGGWTVSQPAQEVQRLFAIIGNVDGVLLGMAWAVMFSSGIAIMLAMYNSMEQRRKQVAVLRVLGASRARVFLLVLTESAIIGLLGGLLGIGLAALGSGIVSGALAERAGIVVQPTLPFDQLLAVAWTTVGLSMAAGLLPAAIAYRVSVARSLRPTG